MSALSIRVDTEPETVVIEASGELDLDSAPTLCAAIQHRRDHHYVIVDLTDVGFCDSTGLRALINAAREVSVAGGEMITVVPEDGPVRRVIWLTGAQEFLALTTERQLRFSAAL